MDLSLRLRLSVMMFLQYFVWGAWAVPLVTFLSALPKDGGLNFPGGYVGLIYGTSAIGAMISPLFVGLFADRLFAAEKVLMVLHVAGAGLLAWAAYSCDQNLPKVQQAFETAAKAEKAGPGSLWDALEEQKRLNQEMANITGPAPASWVGDIFGRPAAEAEHLEALASQKKDLEKKRIEPAVKRVNKLPEVSGAVADAYHPLFWLMLIYAVCYMPTITLTNSLSFRNLSDPDRYFGGIRVLGTIGWIIAGWVVGFGLNPASPQPLYLAAASSAVLGLFCLGLPHTPPSRETKTLGDALGLPAVAMLKDIPFLVFFVCSFLITIPLAFYYSWCHKFLTDIDAPNPTAIMTLGQISEIFFMLLLPVGLARLGTKWMLVLGMLAWCLRYGIFATQNKFAVIAVGLPLHGICYDFFFVVSYLYVDRQAPKHLRASAQGMITFITLGVGTFLGDVLGGEIKEMYTSGSAIDYQRFWLVPLAIAAVAMVLFAALFREPIADGKPVGLAKALEGLEPAEPPEQVH